MSGDFGDVVVGIELRPEAGRGVDGGIKADLIACAMCASNSDVEIQEVV